MQAIAAIMNMGPQAWIKAQGALGRYLGGPAPRALLLIYTALAIDPSGPSAAPAPVAHLQAAPRLRRSAGSPSLQQALGNNKQTIKVIITYNIIYKKM